VPVEAVPKTNVGDHALHGAGYFILGVLFVLTLMAHRRPRRWRPLAALAVLAAYGAFDEVTQALVARSPSLSEWWTDVQGAAAAIIVTELARFLVVRARKRRSTVAADEPANRL